MRNLHMWRGDGGRASPDGSTGGHDWAIVLADDEAWSRAASMKRLVMARLRVDVAQPGLDPRLSPLIATTTGTLKLIELELFSTGIHDKPSSPRADVRAAALLRQIAPAARQADVRVALYPQEHNWLCTLDHAMRLVMRINQPHVGLSFDYGRWHGTTESELEAMLAMVLPRLWNVVVPADVTAKALRSLTSLLSKHGYSGLMTTDHAVRHAAGAD